MITSNKKFLKSTMIVAVCSLLSRVLGLLRNSLLAGFYGATESEGLNDCYAAAFKLPDIIFNLVAFGVMSIVLIPYFSGLLKTNNYKKLNNDCSMFLNLFLLLISIFIILGFFFAPFFVRNFLVKGWTNTSNIQLTIKMTRILLLQVLFMTLSGVFGSYINAVEKFIAYSLALLSYNTGIIVGILFLAPNTGIEGVAWGAVIGSLLHFMIQFAGAVINGFKYSFKIPRFNKEVKELFLIAIPRIITLSSEQVVKFFIVNISSYLFIGSIFIYESAENFSMVPFGMIAVSLSTTLFPVFSKLYAANEFNELFQLLFNKIRTAVFFIFPVIILMIIFRKEIIDILLTYKKFSKQDLLITSNTLGFYLVGIPFFSVSIILVKFLYAQKNSLGPMIVYLTAVIFTILSCYFFSKNYNVVGLSIGRTIGYIIQMLMLVVLIYYSYHKMNLSKIINKQAIKDSVKIIILSSIIFICGLFFQKYINFIEFQKINSLLKIVTIGGFLSVIYIILTYILRIPEAIVIFKKFV